MSSAYMKLEEKIKSMKSISDEERKVIDMIMKANRDELEFKKRNQLKKIGTNYVVKEKIRMMKEKIDEVIARKR